MLAGTVSCLIAAASQRHALRSLAFGIIRFDPIQALITAAVLAALIIAGPIGLAFIFICFLITRKI
jgi:hypothetical protein